MNPLYGEPAKLVEKFLQEIVPDEVKRKRFEIIEFSDKGVYHVIQFDGLDVAINVEPGNDWKGQLKEFVNSCMRGMK